MSDSAPISPSTQVESDRSPVRREWLFTLAAFAVFAALALFAYWPIFPGDPSRLPSCSCADLSQETWYLEWARYSLSHGHNIFFSTWINYPYGSNLAQNTEMPLLGALLIPVTILAGPVASLNLLLYLAVPVSATAMYVVMRRWTGSRIAAVCAGLLYGFSAYMVGEGGGHAFLTFVPLPPIIFYVLHKMIVTRQGSAYRQGASVGLLLVAQFLISPEVAVTTVLLAVVGILIYVLAEWRRLSKETLEHSARGLLTAAMVLVILLAYPVWFMEFGPQHYVGVVRSTVNPFHAVVLGAIIPTGSQRFGVPLLAKYGRATLSGEVTEYLGLPLVLLTTLIVIWYRRNRAILLAAALAVVAYVFTLGPNTGWVTTTGPVPLPFELLTKVPTLDDLLPGRLALYSSMFVAIVVGLGVAELQKQPKPEGSRRIQLRSARSLARRRVIAGVLGVLTVITLIPKWPYQSFPAQIPTFFRSTLVDNIPVGTVTLTYPFPYYPDNQAMTWQAEADMRFKEIGGYLYVRGAQGQASLFPALLQPDVVQEYLVYEESSTPQPDPDLSEDELSADIEQYLARNHVGAVIVDISDPSLENTAKVRAAFSRVLGPPTERGGVAFWLRHET